jgi:hypothetical protein
MILPADHNPASPCEILHSALSLLPDPPVLLPAEPGVSICPCVSVTPDESPWPPGFPEETVSLVAGDTLQPNGLLLHLGSATDL